MNSEWIERSLATIDARDRDIAALKAALLEERNIVDRIWDIFGRPSYNDLRGRSIYDLIGDLKADVERLTSERDWATRQIHAENCNINRQRDPDECNCMVRRERDSALAERTRECAKAVCPFCQVHERGGFSMDEGEHVTRDGTRRYACTAMPLRRAFPEAFEEGV